MGLLHVPELSPAILAQVALLPAIQAVDWSTIIRLLLIPFFPAHAPARFPLLLAAFIAGGPIALAGVVAKLQACKQFLLSEEKTTLLVDS